MKLAGWILIGCGLVLMAIAFAGTVAAQPINANQSQTMCPTNLSDAQGNPYWLPCGSPSSPLAVVVVPQAPVMVTRNSCQPNPITKQVKAYPFCY